MRNYVSELAQHEQDELRAYITMVLIDEEGMTASEVAEVIQDAMDSKLDDLNELLSHAHINQLKFGDRLLNNCVTCKESWNVLEHLNFEELHLDEIDEENLKNHGKLYCICEECGGGDESYLVK